MALFNRTILEQRAEAEISKSFSATISADLLKSRISNKLSATLNEQRNLSSTKTFDIFLSRSSKDAVLVEGLKLSLEDLGYSVYVDWIEDPHLDRKNVTRETALLIRERMRQSDSLIYAFTEHGSHSKWMPWELGYFDTLKSKSAVLPIVEGSHDDSYVGTEYVGIYNYVVLTGGLGGTLYVHASAYKYVSYRRWLNGEKP